MNLRSGLVVLVGCLGFFALWVCPPWSKVLTTYQMVPVREDGRVSMEKTDRVLQVEREWLGYSLFWRPPAVPEGYPGTEVNAEIDWRVLGFEAFVWGVVVFVAIRLVDRPPPEEGKAQGETEKKAEEQSPGAQ